MNAKYLFVVAACLAIIAGVSSCAFSPKERPTEGPAEEVLEKDVYVSLQPQYNKIHDFYNGHAVVENAKGKSGLIDIEGNILVECVYDSVWDLTESYGLCYVSLNGATGLYNSAFEMITKCLYDSFRLPHDGIITLSMNRSLYGALDIRDGSVIIPFEYEHLGNYSEGLFAAEKKVNGESRYGYIDRNNATVIPFIYADANDFSEGVAAVEKDSKRVNTNLGVYTTKVCGFIDEKGSVVIPFKFNAQFGRIEFHEGLCGIGINKEPSIIGEVYKNSFINKAGEVVISGFFDDAEDFSNGVSRIKKSDKYGYMNSKGEIVIPCVYDNYETKHDHLCLTKDGEEYHFTYQGDLILQ